MKNLNCVMVSMLASSEVDRGLESDQVKLKTLTLLFVDSPLSTPNLGERANTE
jgi:hypothetical protein